jgi:Fic-DOC domain mobile mystery protein B
MTTEDLFHHDDAATPLTAEEQRDLKPSHIAFKHELNEAEQENIARAQQWALSRVRAARTDILTEKFILDLHRRMLKDVWKWAGTFRRTERNIGIDWWLIPTELHQLLDDAKAWVEFKSYPPDEIAVRFHHRLVAIHPFPNGNGRHARLMADLLIMRLGGERFTWGSASLRDAGDTRARYIEALKAADRHDFSLLLAFARS